MPPGNELCVRNGSTSKLILRVLTEEKGLDLYLDFNGRLLENPKGFRNNFLTLVYNTCTNSDVPDLFCLEIQATIAGKPYLNGYYLTSYLVGEWNSTGDPFTRMKQNVSTVMINVLSGVCVYVLYIYIPLCVASVSNTACVDVLLGVPVVDGPTANVSGSEAMQSHGTTDTDEYGKHDDYNTCQCH